MTRTTYPTRDAMRVTAQAEAEHAAWLTDRKRRIRNGEDPDAALVADLTALHTRAAYRTRAVRLALATRRGTDGPDLDALQSDAARITAYYEARWPLSGLHRRDTLDRLMEAGR